MIAHAYGNNVGRRAYLIINSLSGGYSRKAECRIERGLADAGLVTERHVVTTLGEALACSASISMSDSAPFIIVAGGDGTINAVLNGLEPGKATLGVIPIGTANLLAMELGFRSTDEALNQIGRGNTRPLSVGNLLIAGMERRFCLMAGVGTDAAVVRGVGKREKQLLKKAAYPLSAMRTLCNWDRQMMTVTVGGEALQCHSVVISNASRYGGDFLLDPDQNVSSPSLTVLCITDNSRVTYAKLAFNLLLGRSYLDRSVRRFVTRELSFTGNKPVQIDGDFVGFASAEVKVIDNFAQVITGC